MGQTAFGLVICNSSLHIIAVSYAPISRHTVAYLHFDLSGQSWMFITFSLDICIVWLGLCL